MRRCICCFCLWSISFWWLVVYALYTHFTALYRRIHTFLVMSFIQPRTSNHKYVDSQRALIYSVALECTAHIWFGWGRVGMRCVEIGWVWCIRSWEWNGEQWIVCVLLILQAAVRCQNLCVLRQIHHIVHPRTIFLSCSSLLSCRSWRATLFSPWEI